MKRSYVVLIIIFTFTLFSIGCSNNYEFDEPTISINQNSEYEKTFKDLNLGLLFDFNFYLPSADKRWVNLWVERYIDGKKDPHPLTQLSYGDSPQEVSKGLLGFGIINPNTDDTLVFLYGPGVSARPSRIENDFKNNVISSWNYALGKEEVELKLGETKILAAYRETESTTIHTIDLQDEDSVDKMIKQDDMVLLLKIKIEDEL